MNELAQTRAALSGAADTHGVSKLLAILERLEDDLERAQAAVQVAGRDTGGLLEFHSALVRLRRALAPIRDAVLACEEEVDALYWSRNAAAAGTEILLAFIRHHKRILTDLIFRLPHHSFQPEGATSEVSSMTL